MRTKANGIEINYQVDGPDGAPWVVFSNSLATNLTMWDPQAAALKDSFRLLRYDQRGHGKSEATGGRYTFDLLAGDIAGLMDALSIRRAHWVGISMGGMTGLRLAQQHPERIDRLVAADCGPASTPVTAQQWEERIAVASEKGMDDLTEPTIARWFPPEFLEKRPPVVEKVREMIRTTPAQGFIGCAGALANYDLRPGLAAIRNPALFLCGTKDAVLPGLKSIHAAVPGSRIVELEGAGHLASVEQPEPFTRAVRDFLAQGKTA